MKQKLLFLSLLFCSATSLFSMEKEERILAELSFRASVEKTKKTSGHKLRKPINEIAVMLSDIEYYHGCQQNHEAYKPSFSLEANRPEAISIEPQDPVFKKTDDDDDVVAYVLKQVEERRSRPKNLYEHNQKRLQRIHSFLSSSPEKDELAELSNFKGNSDMVDLLDVTVNRKTTSTIPGVTPSPLLPNIVSPARATPYVPEQK